MKKVIAILCTCLLLTGCGGTSESSREAKDTKDTEYTSTFATVESGGLLGNYSVVYCKDTKVMYVVSNGAHSQGVFTLLVNPDGSPMLYEESEAQE